MFGCDSKVRAERFSESSAWFQSGYQNVANFPQALQL